MRLAGAPITWGVSEVPGWGHRMSPERVLSEMHDAGLGATELGPPGYLPGNVEQLTALLDTHDLSLAAGFVATVLHVPDRHEQAATALRAAVDAIAAGGGEVLVVAGSAGEAYDRHQTLDRAGWKALVAALHRAEEIASARNLRLAFHPHVGTVVQTTADVCCLLELSSAGLCLDTGHLFLGGEDPLHFATIAGERVTHVHVKDVEGELAERVQGGELAFSDAVRQGLFTPLGAGVVDVAGVVSRLEAAGYGGWYVLEQDVMLDAEPAPGRGPVQAVRSSVAYFASLVAHHRQREREDGR